jgi:hypothetical protein
MVQNPPPLMQHESAVGELQMEDRPALVVIWRMAK